MNLSPSSFRKRYKSSYETPSSSSLASLPTLPVRKRYRGTSELVEDTETEVEESEAEAEAEGIDLGSEESEDEGPDSKGKEAAPKGLRALELAEKITPSTFEVGQSSMLAPNQQINPLSHASVQTTASLDWSSDSLPVSLASLAVPSPVASPVTNPAATIAVDEDDFLEVGVRLEPHHDVLHDHTQRLDASPPALLESHGRDIIELFDRSRAVREEIHS
nr:hypothetical protein [Tanacetum cinerariifolium]